MRCLHLNLCLLFLTACWCTNSSAQEAHQLLLADTTVNYQPQGESILLWDGESEFLFSEADLIKWRVRRPFPEPVINREQAFYPISGFSGSSARYNARAVSINIILPPQVLQPVVASAEGTPTIKPTTGNGLYLDYDLAYLGGDESYYSGFFAPTLFNALGVLHTEHVYRSFDTSSSATESWLRLNTTFTRDDPGRMLTYAAGDVLSAPGPWGDAYRVGGLQIGSNFGTRPSLITAPIPSMLGTAMTPSAVDIYVNGMLRDRQQVEPGNFRIDNLPVVTGAGQVSMVVTDILGREQIYTQDFYTSTDLLRPGLADFSYSLGFLRRNYGYLSNDYGPLAFIGSHRQGMSDQWTMGGRFEVSEHSQMLGASSDWGLNRGGILSTGLSFSNTQDGIGGAWLLGYQYLESGYNLRAQVTGGTEHQAELDPSFYSLPTKLQFAIGGGWSQGIPGSVSASIIHQSFWNRPSRDIVTLSYSQNLPANYHLSVHSSVVSENGSEFAIGMSLNKSFGDRRSTSTLASREAGETRLRAETQYSLPVGPGVGYRLGATFADQNELDANLIGQTETGRYNLDIRSYAGEVAWRANALGSIAWLAGRPYMAREIRDGFAVARIGDFENVRVYVENQEIGRSDSQGRLMLPSLRPYEVNRIRIEAADLPMGAQVETLSMEVSPYFRSGTVVDFPVSFERQALMYAQQQNGEPVPEGATATIDGAGKEFLVGMDGLLYLTGLEEPRHVAITWDDQVCYVDIPRPEGNHPLPNLGTFICEADQ